MEKQTLVTRMIDCSKISEQEFIDAMSADVKNATEIYKTIYWSLEEKIHFSNVERQKKSIVNIAKQYAEKKWKTEKKRQQYIDEQLANFKEPEIWHTNLTYLDFNIEPNNMGISDDCIIRVANLNLLSRCFNKIKDNKYFKQAKGWILETGSRPQIKLILPESVEKKFMQEAKNLADSVYDFYKNTKYFGD